MKTAQVWCYSAFLLVASAASAQQLPQGRTNRTRVVLLGTGQPVPDPDRSGPATAIVVDDTYRIDIETRTKPEGDQRGNPEGWKVNAHEISFGFANPAKLPIDKIAPRNNVVRPVRHHPRRQTICNCLSGFDYPRPARPNANPHHAQLVP